MSRLSKKDTPEKASRKVESRPVWGLLILPLSVLYWVALLDFKPSQWSQLNSGADASRNLAGQVGVELAGWSIHFLGFSTILVPALLFWVAYLLIFKQAQRVGLRLLLSSIMVIIALCGTLRLLEAQLEPSVKQTQVTAPQVLSGDEAPQQSSYFFNGLGGGLGKVLYNDWFMRTIGPFGTVLFLAVTLVLGLCFLFTENLTRSVEYGHERWRQRRKEWQKRKQEEALRKKQAEVISAWETKAPKANKQGLQSGEAVLEGFQQEPSATEMEEEEASVPEKKSNPFFKRSSQKPFESKGVPSPSGITIVEAEQTERTEAHLPDRRGDYIFPKVDLLVESDESGPSESAEDYKAMVDLLVQILDQFNVKVEPSSVQTGPVITRYEIKPAPGVRVEKIASLDKNIALGLKALAVRILAPVPGKGTVGIEVPNKHPLTVGMKEIVESKAWGESKAEIPIVLGKDVTGKPIVEDLTKMPHMLIAGSTGSGKTVCINAVIASLLYHSSPEDLRFIMVDPKVVEMQIYNQLPHMLIPVVTEPKKVPAALKYLLREMERRYQIFARVGVRNIAGFNAKVLKSKSEREAAEKRHQEIASAMSPEERMAASSIEVPRDLELDIPEQKLPYIICIIDELADLMMVAPQDIETGVARLAQLARAAGIHLILATQRPSVNVITGVIKANLPTRISFKVASKVDSRTILDTGGAESLIGKGDMLFIPPGTHSLVRAQGAFVSDEEINAIVGFINENNGPPQFDTTVQAAVESEDEEGSGGGVASATYEDDLIPAAIDVLKATKRASTSMLQRRLKIGYNRAARIMEILEDEGIVGPENGSSPREILRDLDSL